ncbi:hypothetical protein EB118_15425, partial [bacterium]|nr:hypothetical protein [bacterium]
SESDKEDTTDLETIKKKRGRKKKDPVPEEPAKQKKKRGRKAAVKYFSSSIRKQIPLTSQIQEKDNFILHLDVKETTNSSSSNTLPPMGDDQLVKSVIQEIQETFNDNMLEEDIAILLEEKIKDRQDQDQVIVTKLEHMHLDVEDEFEDFDDDNVPQNDSRIQGHFSVLCDFIENIEWLKKTDVWCWWCCHPFDSVPIGLPVHYDEKIRKFRVKGVFCSFSCCLAYKQKHYKPSQADQLLKSLYKQITGAMKIDSAIVPAPPQCSLTVFGGKLSITEFRNCTNEHKIMKMVEYPMFVSRDYIEEIDIKNVKNVNMKVLNEQYSTTLDNKRVCDAKARLQSQIDKTTIVTGNTIDKFIDVY